MRWFALVALVACGKDDDSAVTVPATGTTTPAPSTSIVPLGTPMWTVSDVALFTAPIAFETEQCLLEGPHVFDGTLWSPGEAHPPPYGDEISGALTRCGATAKKEFEAADMQGGSAIWLGLVVEAAEGNAPGSSPDFPLGDVIYFDRFPIVADGDVRRADLLVDTANDVIYPGAETWGFVVTGLSHLPLLLRTSLERMPAGASPQGDYEWRVALRDATSIQGDQGYDVVVPYTVAPAAE